jgi:hypothetical protein
MTEAPENITLTPNHLFGSPWSNAYISDDDPMEDGEDTSYGYTRTDIAHSREVTQIEWVKYLADTVIKHEARIAELEAALTECQEEIDQYVRQEYSLNHPLHERYRQRDFASNPARIALANLKEKP